MSRVSPGRLAQVACVLEATARKPGNVHRFADFEDATYLDFVLSAGAIAGPMDRARRIGVGAAVLEAVEATREVVATNMNLGMILLLAPLAAVPDEEPDLRAGVGRVLAGLSVEDARLVYRAIRLARPGGLGEAPEQDVAAEPDITLIDAMRLAADRDLVARQYAGGFAEVFDPGVVILRESLAAGMAPERAIVRAFLMLMARHPDTLIARKLGIEAAREASRLSARALESGSTGELDGWLRADGHRRNPGTTADLICASIYAALRDGTLPLPLAGGPAGWSGEAIPGLATED